MSPVVMSPSPVVNSVWRVLSWACVLTVCTSVPPIWNGCFSLVISFCQPNSLAYSTVSPVMITGSSAWNTCSVIFTPPSWTYCENVSWLNGRAWLYLFQYSSRSVVGVSHGIVMVVVLFVSVHVMFCGSISWRFTSCVPLPSVRRKSSVCCLPWYTVVQ